MMGHGHQKSVLLGEIQLSTRCHAASYGAWDRVFVCFGRSAPDVVSAKKFRWAALDFTQGQTSPTGFLLVLRRPSTPTAAAREPTIQVFKNLVESGVAAMAFVIEADGFVAASQRSIATAFLLTTARGIQVKVFKRVSDAVNWLLPRVYGDSSLEDERALTRGIVAFMEAEEAKG